MADPGPGHEQYPHIFEQDLIRRHQPAAVFPVRVSREPPPQGAAVFPDPVQRLDHEGLEGDPLADGGQLPAFASSAKMGASLNVFGIRAGSVRFRGPSSFPIYRAPSGSGLGVPARTRLGERQGQPGHTERGGR